VVVWEPPVASIVVIVKGSVVRPLVSGAQVA
jgi:hypothetical protein